MATIAYDRPVADFIAGLNATEHVTHTKHRKTRVTYHHNGGRLSLQGILNVWKTRPASAHFQVDGAGKVGQYVNVNEYAWATGSTKGNQESISIEMANSTLAPEWRVADATWKNAARLAGWLFYKVIGTRPNKDNLVPHHYWKSTLCAGPYMDKMAAQMVSHAQWWYDQFKKGAVKPVTKPAPKPVTKPTARKTNATLATEVLAGKWGNGDDRERRLKAAGYNFDAVQAEVNRRLGAGAPSAEPKKSISTVAAEVIRGLWGNGPDRRRRLEGAGYNFALVQAEVNRRIR
jgi:hypothetical protein